MAASRLRFQKRLANDLGPEFDCIHCRRPEYDEPNAGNCPGCPRTILNETCREEADEEVREVLHIEPDEEEMASIERIYTDVSRRLGENGDRIDPEWAWERGLLARSALYEDGRLRLLENWQTAQKLRAAEAASRRRR